MKLETMEKHQFGVGLADPGMELLNNGEEFWLTYTFDGMEPGYRLDVDELEVSVSELVADSRYPASDYEVLDFTRDEEQPVFQIDVLVDIDPEGKTEDELYEELWPITHEMNRLDPEDYKA